MRHDKPTVIANCVECDAECIVFASDENPKCTVHKGFHQPNAKAWEGYSPARNEDPPLYH